MSKNPPIESTYQKKSLIEHVLLRPDTYVGSIQPITQKMWVYNKEANRVVQEVITYTPGLYKIFGKFIKKPRWSVNLSCVWCR